MKSIKRVEQELHWVRNTRNYIATLLKDVAEVNVLIGGSYALKYQCDSFSNREVSDYDFIIRANEYEISKVRDLFASLVKLGIAIQGYSSNEAYVLESVCLNGKHAECIIVPVPDGTSICNFRKIGRIWEKPINVIQAKEKYVADYKAKGLEPRPKDISDIENYYKNEAPFLSEN